MYTVVLHPYIKRYCSDVLCSGRMMMVVLTSVKHVFFFNLDAKQLHMNRNILRAVMRFTNGYIHIGVFI